MTAAAAAAQSHPAAAAARIHPAAWAVALALHLAMLAALLPRPRDLPGGPAFVVGLSGLRAASEAERPAEGGAPAEAAAEPTAEAPLPPPPLAMPMPPADAPPLPAMLAEPALAPIAPPPVAPPPPLPAMPAEPALAAIPPPPVAPPPPPRAAMPVPRAIAAAPPGRSPARNAVPPTRAAARRTAPRQATPAGANQGTPPGGPGPAAAAAPAAGPSGGPETGFTPLPPDYAAAVARILRRGLRYPPPARDQGIEGTAMVRFAIARDGTIIAAQLVRGSGSVLLDHEALALLRRVSPLPRLPEAVPDASAAVLVPIVFTLN